MVVRLENLFFLSFFSGTIIFYLFKALIFLYGKRNEDEESDREGKRPRGNETIKFLALIGIIFLFLLAINLKDL